MNRYKVRILHDTVHEVQIDADSPKEAEDRVHNDYLDIVNDDNCTSFNYEIDNIECIGKSTSCNDCDEL